MVALEAQKESQMARPLGAVEAEENWENQPLPLPEPAALARWRFPLPLHPHQIGRAHV